MMKKNRQLTKSGFTLVEIITVLFVVSLGLMGVLSLIVQNIQSQDINKNNLIAYQLAQEGVELARHARDSDWRSNPPVAWGYSWTDDDPNWTEGRYFMDYRDVNPHLVQNQAETNLLIDSNGFYYHQFPAPPNSIFSGFKRDIRIYKVDNDSVKVIVRVDWQSRARQINYSLETLLYNWH